MAPAGMRSQIRHALACVASLTRTRANSTDRRRHDEPPPLRAGHDRRGGAGVAPPGQRTGRDRHRRREPRRGRGDRPRDPAGTERRHRRSRDRDHRVPAPVPRPRGDGRTPARRGGPGGRQPAGCSGGDARCARDVGRGPVLARRPDRSPRGHGRRGLRRARDSGSGRRPRGRDRRDPCAAGHGRRRDDGRGCDRLDRTRPDRSRRTTGGLRSRLPRVRARRGDPVRSDPAPYVGRSTHRYRAGIDAPARDGLGAGGLRGRGPRVGRRVHRAAARRPRCRAVRGARDRDRVDRARIRGGPDPGRHRAHRGLRDHRRCRRHPARHRRARPGRLGAGTNLDPGVRCRPERLRGVGSRHPLGVLHGPRRGPARVGDPVAGAGCDPRPGRDRQRRRAGARGLRCPWRHRRAGDRWTAGCARHARRPVAAPVLRAAARGRCRAPRGRLRRWRRPPSGRYPGGPHRRPQLAEPDLVRQPGRHRHGGCRAPGGPGARCFVRGVRCVGRRGRTAADPRHEPRVVRPRGSAATGRFGRAIGRAGRIRMRHRFRAAASPRGRVEPVLRTGEASGAPSP